VSESIHLSADSVVKFTTDVIFELSSIGLRPEEEFLAKSGYRLDALVEVKGTKVGIEVDGP
jgi:hypothetical protein